MALDEILLDEKNTRLQIKAESWEAAVGMAGNPHTRYEDGAFRVGVSVGKGKDAGGGEARHGFVLNK
jgi:hypothetical protein